MVLLILHLVWVVCHDRRSDLMYELGKVWRGLGEGSFTLWSVMTLFCDNDSHRAGYRVYYRILLWYSVHVYRTSDIITQAVYQSTAVSYTRYVVFGFHVSVYFWTHNIIHLYIKLIFDIDSLTFWLALSSRSWCPRVCLITLGVTWYLVHISWNSFELTFRTTALSAPSNNAGKRPLSRWVINRYIARDLGDFVVIISLLIGNFVIISFVSLGHYDRSSCH